MSQENNQASLPLSDELVEKFLSYCRGKNPEGLHTIFKHYSSQVTWELLNCAITAFFYDDVDSLAWLCSYTALEIKCSADNDKKLPTKEISKILIKLGMIPYTDFVPNFCDRLIIYNINKFEALHPDIKALLYENLDLTRLSQKNIKAFIDEFII
jgi:hypothetical protein